MLGHKGRARAYGAREQHPRWNRNSASNVHSGGRSRIAAARTRSGQAIFFCRLDEAEHNFQRRGPGVDARHGAHDAEQGRDKLADVDAAGQLLRPVRHAEQLLKNTQGGAVGAGARAGPTVLLEELNP